MSNLISNQNFEDQMIEFKQYIKTSFAEMHRLIDMCDEAEIKCLRILKCAHT